MLLVVKETKIENKIENKRLISFFFSISRKKPRQQYGKLISWFWFSISRFLTNIPRQQRRGEIREEEDVIED